MERLAQLDRHLGGAHAVARAFVRVARLREGARLLVGRAGVGPVVVGAVELGGLAVLADLFPELGRALSLADLAPVRGRPLQVAGLLEQLGRAAQGARLVSVRRDQGLGGLRSHAGAQVESRCGFVVAARRV